MKQTIEIEVPDGKEAVWKDGKVVFEDIKPQLPKTWKEFCSQNPVKKYEYIIGVNSNILEPNWGARNIYEDKYVLPSKQAAEAHLALMQLHQLRDCYRQGWKPKFQDCNFTIVYNIEWKLVVGAYQSSRFLSFQSKEIADEFLTNFRNLIKEAGDLI